MNYNLFYGETRSQKNRCITPMYKESQQHFLFTPIRTISHFESYTIDNNQKSVTKWEILLPVHRNP